MYNHRRNHPKGRVPSNYGDHGEQVYLVPSNFCNWLPFFLWAVWEEDQTSLLNLRGEGKSSRKENG